MHIGLQVFSYDGGLIMDTNEYMNTFILTDTFDTGDPNISSGSIENIRIRKEWVVVPIEYEGYVWGGSEYYHPPKGQDDEKWKNYNILTSSIQYCEQYPIFTVEDGRISWKYESIEGVTPTPHRVRVRFLVFGGDVNATH